MPPPTLAVLLAVTLAAATSSAAPLDDDRARALTSSSPLASTAAYLRAKGALSRLGNGQAEAAFVDEVAERAVDPLTRARARMDRLTRQAATGALVAARAEARALGVVEEALFFGPYDNPGGVLVAQPFPFELDAGDVERGFVVETDPRAQRFDLGAQLVEVTDLRGALAFVVHCEKDTEIALRIANAGQLVVRVNGETRRVVDGDRPLTFDQTHVGARLPRGKSLVVVGLGALSRPLEARVRLTAPDGGPLVGVKTSALVEDVRAALGTRPLTGTEVVVADPAREIERFTAHPPLVRAPTGDDDVLVDAIAYEHAVRADDQRLAPRTHEVWLFALRTRVRLGRAGGRAPPIEDILVEVAENALEKDPSSARQALDEALAIAERHARARALLAALRDRQGFTRDARAHYARALEDAGDDAVVAAEALRFLRTFGEDRPRTDRLIVERARGDAHPALARFALDVLIERGDVSSALPFADRVFAVDEADPAALRVHLDALAALLATDDDEERARGFERARALLERRVLHHPSSHRDFRRLVLVLHARGEDKAVDALLEARKREYPLRAEVPGLVAELALYDGDAERAREALDEALSRAPQNADLARTRALLDDEARALPDELVPDLARIASEPPPPGAADIGAYVASRAIVIDTFDNGLASVVEDQVIRVVDAKKAGALRTVRTGYVEGRERLSVLVADRVTRDGVREAPQSITDTVPDGKVGGVYTDEKTRVVTFRQLADGDLLHVRTRMDLVGRQNLFGDFFGRVEAIQGELPTERFTLRVTVPRTRTLAYGGRNVPTPVVTERDDARTYTFSVARAPRVKTEEAMPPFLEVADFISLSTYERWEDLGAWYQALIRDSLFVDDELRAVARRVVAGAKTDDERVRRLYEYVVTSTRYLGIELGIHGWKPYPVSLVHRRRYGDCKDKASLLYALLEEVGIEARLALVRTADIGVVEPSPASMWLFNHAIAYVPSLDLYLDGTAERSGYRELPSMDQGALVLIVDPKGRAPAATRTIPVDDAEKNLNRSAYLMDVREDGTVVIEVGEERFRGTHAARERSTFADAATRKERLEATLAHVLPGISLLSLEVSDLSLSTTEVGYRMSAMLPGRAQRDTDGALVLPLSLYPHDLVESYARRSERTHDVWLDAPWKTQNVMRYRLPPGVVVAELPRSSVVTAPGFRFEQRITKTSDGFIVDEETAFTARRVDVADYAELRAALARADALMRARVRLTNTTRGGS